MLSKCLNPFLFGFGQTDQHTPMPWSPFISEIVNFSLRSFCLNTLSYIDRMDLLKKMLLTVRICSNLTFQDPGMFISCGVTLHYTNSVLRLSVLIFDLFKETQILKSVYFTSKHVFSANLWACKILGLLQHSTFSQSAFRGSLWQNCESDKISSSEKDSNPIFCRSISYQWFYPLHFSVIKQLVQFASNHNNIHTCSITLIHPITLIRNTSLSKLAGQLP